MNMLEQNAAFQMPPLVDVIIDRKGIQHPHLYTAVVDVLSIGD